MKKRWLAILIAIATCLAVLSGCSFVKVFEKDVQVVLRNGEEYVGTYTVNIFNNAVVPEPTKAGYKFAGWSPKEDWTEGTDSEDLLSENTGLIRYDDVKDYVAGENQSVTLYAAYTAIPKRDLVIAWYNKETTSGINQATMDEFKTALFEFLTSKGYKPDTMSIDIRGYEGDVGTSCGAIMKDGDVDIMVGWANSNNLTNTGGMTEGVDFLENIGNIKIGSKERYIARKTDTELCNLVYDWIHVTYSTVPVEPEPDPEPDPGPTEPVLVIAWYNLEKTSGLNQTIMDNFNAALKTYLAEHNHTLNCFEMYDKTSIANTLSFFDETLGMESGTDPYSQIWFGKEVSNGLALAAAFTFVIALCAVLMGVPFFATIKNGKKAKACVAEGPAADACTAEIAAGEAVADASEIGAEKPTDAPPDAAVAAVQKPKTFAHKVVFWTTMILTAIIACLDYIPLANLSIEIFPTGNSSSVFTYVFPARMINAILLWAVINGAIGLVLYYGTTLVENLYEKLRAKAKGTMPVYDWAKLEPVKIHGEKWHGVLFNVLKMLLLCVILFCSFYFLVQLCYWIFHQDFRFMLISAAPLNARMFVTALEYIPLILLFYVSNAIRVNGSIGREGWKEWKVLLVGALANSIGLAFILVINYVCFFMTGAPFYGYWGNGTEVWLYVNMVFSLVVMMFILPIFNRIFYKLTGSVWVGAIVCCSIFIMMTISASVSYIPM